MRDPAYKGFIYKTSAQVADQLAGANMVTGKYVGLEGSVSKQWLLYENLCAVSTDEELEKLTNDQNAVVRCYAFEALSERKSPKLKSILMSHINDTSLVTIQRGCVIDRQPVLIYLSECMPQDFDNMVLFQSGNKKEKQ